MVTVVDFKKRSNSEGEDFFSLVIQGGVEMIQSQETGRFYATARKTSIPSTFNEVTCKSLVGQQIPGSIKKVEVDPYEYTPPNSEESITLTHSYQFVPQTETDLVKDTHLVY